MTREALIQIAGSDLWYIAHLGLDREPADSEARLWFAVWCDRQGAILCRIGEETRIEPLPRGAP